MTENIPAARARTDRRSSFSLFLHNGKAGERGLFDAGCPAFRSKGRALHLACRSLEPQSPPKFQERPIQRSPQAHRPSNRARHLPEYPHARVVYHRSFGLGRVLRSGGLWRACRYRHQAFLGYCSHSGAFDRSHGGLPPAQRAPQRLAGRTMSREVRNRRSAVVRFLLWSGILMAAAAFWIAVAVGLAAWAR
jgi:hypothetical protein